jgi:hypothetical protein
MSFIVEADFLGRRIDLLGRVDVTLGTALGPYTIFQTDNKEWPAPSGKTFVAFCTIERTDGGTQFDAPAVGRFNAPSSGVYDWSTTFFLINAGNPITIYVGLGLVSEVDLTILPGNIANGVDFRFTLISWAPNPDVPCTISAYGWAY